MVSEGLQKFFIPPDKIAQSRQPSFENAEGATGRDKMLNDMIRDVLEGRDEERYLAAMRGQVYGLKKPVDRDVY